MPEKSTASRPSPPKPAPASRSRTTSRRDDRPELLILSEASVPTARARRSSGSTRSKKETITRKEAKKQGLKRYYTGRTCPKGHNSERIVSNGCCVKCLHINTSVLNKKYPERSNNRNKRWRANNPEKALQKSRKYKELRKQLTVKWRFNNYDRHRANQRRGAKTHEERYPEKAFSRRVLVLAVKYGIVIRKPCVTCGNSKSQAHHTDYYAPLDVIWLCQKHHQEAHRAG